MEIGVNNAAREIGVTSSTISTWRKASKEGKLDLGDGSYIPSEGLSLSQENAMLRQQIKENEKEIKLLKKTNDFLEEDSAFFAASRLK